MRPHTTNDTKTTSKNWHSGAVLKPCKVHLLYFSFLSSRTKYTNYISNENKQDEQCLLFSNDASHTTKNVPRILHCVTCGTQVGSSRHEPTGQHSLVCCNQNKKTAKHSVQHSGSNKNYEPCTSNNSKNADTPSLASRLRNVLKAHDFSSPSTHFLHARVKMTRRCIWSSI